MSSLQVPPFKHAHVGAEEVEELLAAAEVEEVGMEDELAVAEVGVVVVEGVVTVGVVDVVVVVSGMNVSQRAPVYALGQTHDDWSGTEADPSASPDPSSAQLPPF